MKKEYSWNINGFFKEDANEVGKELEKLENNLTPENVVNLARNENSVLHNMFEWDDSVAAEQWRKRQATTIIINLRVNIVASEEEKPKKVRAFVSTKKNTGFKTMEAVINDTDQYQLLLDKAYKELYSIKLKYETLKEIQDLLKDIPEKF